MNSVGKNDPAGGFINVKNLCPAVKGCIAGGIIGAFGVCADSFVKSRKDKVIKTDVLTAKKLKGIVLKHLQNKERKNILVKLGIIAAAALLGGGIGKAVEIMRAKKDTGINQKNENNNPVSKVVTFSGNKAKQTSGEDGESSEDIVYVNMLSLYLAKMYKMRQEKAAEGPDNTVQSECIVNGEGLPDEKIEASFEQLNSDFADAFANFDGEALADDTEIIRKLTKDILDNAFEKTPELRDYLSLVSEQMRTNQELRDYIDGSFEYLSLVIQAMQKIEDMFLDTLSEMIENDNTPSFSLSEFEKLCEEEEQKDIKPEDSQDSEEKKD